MISDLFQKAKQADIIDREPNHLIEFRPFIKNCDVSHIISNPSVQSLNYLYFTYDIKMEIPLNINPDEDFIPETREEYKICEKLPEDQRDELITTIDLINSVRCPENWYKEGSYKLS